MRFFGKFLGDDGDEPPRIDAGLSVSSSKGSPDNERASDELLLRLGKGHPFGDTFQSDWWTEALGAPAERVLDRLLQEGALEPKFRLADLKPLMEQYGLKKSGKKADLLARLVEAMAPEEAVALFANVRAFAPTPAGTAQINAYLARCEAEKSETERKILVALDRGDMQAAGDAAAAYAAAQVFPRGIGIDWSEGYPPPYLEEFSQMMADPQVALPYPADIKKKIAAQLVLAQMMGEDGLKWTRRVLEVTGGAFECPDIDDFLHDPVGGYASGIDRTNPQEVADLYLHTLSFRASAMTSLKKLRTQRSLGLKGIEILNVRDQPCRVCDAGRHKFSFAQLADLPALPRHWGCRCLYAASWR